MDEGEPVKATIYQYFLKRVDRPGDERKVSSASFVYIRGKEHADNIIQTWKDMGKPWKEELPFSKYIDSFSGGWKGVENYKKHDIPYYELQKIPGLVKENKNLVFEHFNFHGVAKLLEDVYGVKDKIDKLEKNKCPAMPA
jgi:hypothetical protein